MGNKKLSKGEKAFVLAFNGNIKETAIAIKMSYGYCRKIMTYGYIQDAIRKREENVQEIKTKPVIASRQERQEFWTGVMLGTIKEKKTIFNNDNEAVEIEVSPAMRDRLKAAELLGKSFADFTENLVHTGLGEGIKQEITDQMPQKEATNIYLQKLKEPHAGNA